MAFVYEKVGEENKELWESIGWKDWWDELISFRASRRWSINSEKKIYMQPIGKFIDTPTYYDLCYKGRIVRMEVYYISGGSIEEGVIFDWKIKRISIPKSIWDEKDEIMKEIVNSFLVVRNAFDEDEIKNITAEIICEPECVEVDYNGR